MGFEKVVFAREDEAIPHFKGGTSLSKFLEKSPAWELILKTIGEFEDEFNKEK